MRLRDLITELGLGAVFDADPSPGVQLDLQGWGSHHPIFAKAIHEIQPAEIIEVGSWKGASAIQLTSIARGYQPGVTTICVDTFLGSNATVWTDRELRQLLPRDENGYPALYRQFLHNVVTAGLSDHVFPLPMTSVCAAAVMRAYDVRADLIYLDAGHEHREVLADIGAFWHLLRPGGLLLGDDYSPDWPGVMRAVDEFSSERKLRLCFRPLYRDDGKWLLRKPGG